MTTDRTQRHSRGGFTMEMNTMPSGKGPREERRYSVPHGPNTPLPPAGSEDLHAWSIYRQNLNSDFTDSALGSSDKSPLPYGNFQLRDTIIQSILNHPRYGPKSPLGSNMYTYLKFGLPRVFPPNSASQRSHRAGPGPGPGPQSRGRVNRGFRDSTMQVIAAAAGSSGYDSSDNETTRGRVPANLRKFRSESDFRALNVGLPQHASRPSSRAAHSGNIPLAALRQANSRASIAGTHVHPQHIMVNSSRYYGNRSHSEADLLSGGGAGHMGDGYDYESRLYAPSRARSEQQQAHSMSPRAHSSMGLVYPNIQVHCLDVVPGLRGISLQAKAGDLFAVMATSQKDGTALMEAIAGIRERASGEILVNGQHISQRGLCDLCSFVAASDKASLDPRMSVQSTLSFHASLRAPLDKSDLKERIDILIEDLGLTAVHTANVSRLTYSEKQRLSVACQLLSQPSVLVLDQATTNMDIFDTFFLVEYLRQWCSSGRIVIMTLQPPTFEILSMCSGVLLLSGGRTIFSGSRSDLPRHMGALGYPCPPFKNPADYYLDLVTLDDLSAAAMLESSARIESLANAWDQVNAEAPIAAPLASFPALTRRAGLFGQISAIGKRFAVYKQPGSLLAWITKLITAAVLSLLIGCIFWDVPATDPQLELNDRLGYHHCMMAVGFWPLLILTIRDLHNDRRYAEKDMSLGLYSRLVYIVVQTLLSVLPSLCIWLAFLLPAHSMAGLYSYSAGNSDTGVYMYIGYMLLYLMVLQTLALFSTHFLPTKTSATVFTGLALLALTSAGGYSIHWAEVPSYWSWLHYVSPQKWLLPVLTAEEYSPETIATTAGQQVCRNKQIQRQEIIVQQPCPPPNGTVILAEYHLLPRHHIINPNNMELATMIALFIYLFVLFVFTSIVFATNMRKIFSKRKATRK